MNNPVPVTNFIDPKEEYSAKRPDLGKIPILTHYKRDAGAYITAGVVFAKDPDTGVHQSTECLYWIKRHWLSGLCQETYTLISRRLRHKVRTCRLQ